MLNRLENNTSHDRHYYIFFITTTLVMAISLLAFIFYLKIIHKEESAKAIEKESLNIIEVISDSFEYANHINSFVGNRIVNHHDDEDLDFIFSLLKEIGKTQNSNSELLSWTSFDWVNNKNLQVINSRLGVRKDPPNMSARQYTANAPENPWSLQVSFPTLGNPSNMWVIPAGTGVVNDKNEFLGIVVVGFNIVEFEGKIQKKLINKDVHFTVLDNDLNIVLQSSGNILKPSDDFYKNHHFDQKSGKLQNPIIIGNIKYGYFQKMEEYPYIILTGFNEAFLSKKFNHLILPRILEFIAITAFFLLILYLFKTKALILLKAEQSLKTKLHTSNQKLKSLTKTVSHDLRNYISGIIGLAHIISEDRDLNKEDLKAILRQDKKYASMIANQAEIMLKFSKSLISDEGLKDAVENGTLNSEAIEEVNVCDLISELIFLLKPFSKSNFVSIKFDVPEHQEASPLIVKTNLIELRKILDNLIINAIKYSRKDSEVTIKMEQSISNISNLSAKFYIEITDNGIGMSKDEIVKALSGEGAVIDKSALNKTIDSNGIGLPIVKKAVENLGAKMEFSSVKGSGTTVKLWIDNVAIVQTALVISPQIKTILVIDDEELLLISVRHQLVNLGVNVLIAKDSQEAIDILDNHSCDMVLIDTNMKEIGDGLETTKTIRKGLIFKNFKNFKSILIIGLSSNIDAKSKEIALKSGMNSYLEKPFNKKHFIALANLLIKEK
ncbi:MAG: signal transduction histidine kinase/CheY-like chemotaxis protein [Lentimonas sp.]|jgi:signal transduction histidine kinase/CheY-like chemotaxis protein